MTPVDVILEAGCAATGTTPAALRASDHAPPMVARRAFIAAKMRREGYSYPVIGKALGRHHTTVMNLLGRVHGERKARRR